MLVTYLTLKDLFGKVVGFLLLGAAAMGLFTTVVVPYEMYRKAQAEDWPSRKGVLTVSYAARKRGSKGEQYWTPVICGTYRESGEKVCVHRVRFGGFRFGEGRSEAHEAATKYPVGREVDVYYSPDDPKDIVLEARSSWKEMSILFGLGMFFLLIPVFLWAFRKKIDPERYGDA